MVRITSFLRASDALEKIVMKKRPITARKFTERPAQFKEEVKQLKKEKQQPSIKKKIVDSIVLNVKGGSGGCGNLKLRGKGGNGGDLYFIATKGETLQSVKEKLPYDQIVAESGGDANHNNHCLGKDGKDKWIPVPVGVNIYDNIGNYLGCLSKESHSMLIAKGGRGGNAKNNYKIKGGATVTTKVELQVVADVGLIGLQGSGKTTLMYHLTLPIPTAVNKPEPTVYAEVKSMVYPDHRQITILDTPHVWSGMGTDKNRHAQKLMQYLQRTRLLLICLDATGCMAGPRKRLNLFESYALLNREMELFNPKLLKRPSIVVVNKYNHAESQFSDFKSQLGNISDHMAQLPLATRPSEYFNVKNIVGMNLQMKEEDKLNDLWHAIRHNVDIFEQERLENEIERSRQLRNNQREERFA